jgi:hypothetical protein
MLRGLAVVFVAVGVLAVPGVSGAAPVAACPTATWDLISTNNDPFLVNIDKNGDGFICRLPQRTPEGSRHSGVTVVDNNRQR